MFELTGLGTLIAACVIAVLGVIAAILVPPGLFRSGRTRTGWAAQVLAVLLVPVLLLAAGGIAVNRSFSFYGSWADLFQGTGAVSSTTVGGRGAVGDLDNPGEPRAHAGGQYDATLPAPSAADLQQLTAAQSAPVSALQKNATTNQSLHGVKPTEQGQWIEVTIPGRASDITQTARVYLPRGYLQHPDQRYPVIYAYQGYPGNTRVWTQPFRIDAIVQGLADEGVMREPIIVAPNVYPAGLDTECVDRKDGTNRWNQWITEDVPQWVQTNLRTVESRWARAAVGYSAGGWCASMVSVQKPELMAASINLAGYFEPIYSHGQQWRPQGDPAYSLPELVKQHQPDVRMLFFSGGDDPEPLASLKGMEPAVSASGGRTTLTIALTERGAHMITLWEAAMDPSLRWLAAAAPGFAPAG